MYEHRIAGELGDQPLPFSCHLQAAIASLQKRQGLGFRLGTESGVFTILPLRVLLTWPDCPP